MEEFSVLKSVFGADEKPAKTTEAKTAVPDPPSVTRNNWCISPLAAELVTRLADEAPRSVPSPYRRDESRPRDTRSPEMLLRMLESLSFTDATVHLGMFAPGSYINREH